MRLVLLLALSFAVLMVANGYTEKKSETSEDLDLQELMDKVDEAREESQLNNIETK